MQRPSSISSSELVSEPLPEWRRAALRLLRLLVLMGIIGFVIGEVWFRLPWTDKLLLWQFDDERVSRLAPDQSRSLGMGNFSVLSPPITINADGYRGGPIDWSTPTVLSLGSSEVLGPGVADHETWSARLGEKLRSALAAPITVVNAGSGRYGPYHHAITLKKFLAQHPPPRLVIVRCSIGDRNFREPSRGQIEAARRSNAFSTAVKEYTEFLPFLLNKVEAQTVALENALKPNQERDENTALLEPAEIGDRMWEGHGKHWEDIVNRTTAAGIPTLLFVEGAFAQPSEMRLLARIKERFGSRPLVRVTMFGPEQLDLRSETLEEKRAEFGRRYTLGYDPHANSARHELIASFLASEVLAPEFRGSWDPARGTAPSHAGP